MVCTLMILSVAFPPIARPSTSGNSSAWSTGFGGLTANIAGSSTPALHDSTGTAPSRVTSDRPWMSRTARASKKSLRSSMTVCDWRWFPESRLAGNGTSGRATIPGSATSTPCSVFPQIPSTPGWGFLSLSAPGGSRARLPGGQGCHAKPSAVHSRISSRLAGWHDSVGCRGRQVSVRG